MKGLRCDMTQQQRAAGRSGAGSFGLTYTSEGLTTPVESPAAESSSNQDGAFIAGDHFYGWATHARLQQPAALLVSCTRLPLILAVVEEQQESECPPWLAAAPEADEELITLRPHHVSVSVPDGIFHTLQIIRETLWPHKRWHFQCAAINVFVY